MSSFVSLFTFATKKVHLRILAKFQLPQILTDCEKEYFEEMFVQNFFRSFVELVSIEDTYLFSIYNSSKIASAVFSRIHPIQFQELARLQMFAYFWKKVFSTTSLDFELKLTAFIRYINQFGFDFVEAFGAVSRSSCKLKKFSSRFRDFVTKFFFP